MLKNPFSFDGRIRRTEYGVTFIIYLVLYFINLVLLETYPAAGLVMLIPMLWFFWAQGAKRCHDLTKSGWWQIIPFFFLWLLFQDSDSGRNEYGPNPKGIGNTGVGVDLSAETLDGHMTN